MFRNKLKESCSGSGDEARKITTLHSSSLCALLFFYNVKNHPLTIMLNDKQITFNDVVFEYKNHVTEKGGPSNMDVVLISDSDRAILFLESKFSEYLYPGIIDIRYAYKKEFGDEIYNEEFISRLGLTFIDKDNADTNHKWIKYNKKGVKEEYFTIGPEQKKSPVYTEGIKQFISHFIGVRNFTKTGSDLSEERDLNNSYSIYLGEILFDKFNFPEADEALETYTDYYRKLVIELNKLQHNFTLVEKPLKYSMLNGMNEPLIRRFYNI